MTVRALAGLLLLNVAYLAAGTSLLWALRGWRTWTEYVRFAGLAYLLGVAAVGIASTLLLSLAIPFGVATPAAAGRSPTTGSSRSPRARRSRSRRGTRGSTRASSSEAERFRRTMRR